MKIVVAIVIFLFLAPIIFIFGLQMLGAGMMTVVFYKVLSIGQPEGDPFGGKIDVRNAKVTSQHFRPGLKAVAEFGNFNSARVIHVATVTTLCFLLKTGEELPSRDSHDLYVRSRVGFIAKEECKRPLELLARDCEISKTNANHWRGNLYNINFKLRFIQKDEFGELNSEAKLNYTEIRDDFSF